MLSALGSIASKQAAPTAQTMQHIQKLLEYAATHPDAIITYRASDMVLTGYNEASYLYETKSRSRAGGQFLMTYESAEPPHNESVTTI